MRVARINKETLAHGAASAAEEVPSPFPLSVSPLRLPFPASFSSLFFHSSPSSIPWTRFVRWWGTGSRRLGWVEVDSFRRQVFPEEVPLSRVTSRPGVPFDFTKVGDIVYKVG